MLKLLTKEFLAVAGGGAIGSVLRFELSRWVQAVTPHKDYPWGIFTVNVVGCFAMGVLFGILADRMAVGAVWRSALLIGVLGGFTTFSSFSIDTVTLIQAGDYSSAMLNIALTVCGCLIATTAGLWLTKSFI